MRSNFKFQKLYSLLSDKSSRVGQIVKYVFCGGTSVAVDALTFCLLAWLVLPCLRESDPFTVILEMLGFSVKAATEAQIAHNFLPIKGICFLVSNSVVYCLNVLFVFEAGRHKKPVEILLFFGASLFQFFFIWLGRVLIVNFKWEVTYSNIAMLFVGIVLNYFIRKFLVFKR